jgi:hypothetical protein
MQELSDRLAFDTSKTADSLDIIVGVSLRLQQPRYQGRSSSDVSAEADRLVRIVEYPTQRSTAYAYGSVTLMVGVA